MSKKVGRFHSFWFLMICFMVLTLLLSPFAISRSAYAEEALSQSSQPPIIVPTPQSVQIIGKGFVLPPTVGLVVGDQVDESSVSELKRVLQDAGVQTTQSLREGQQRSKTSVTVWVGVVGSKLKSAEGWGEMAAYAPKDLPAEGYLLASGGEKSGKVIVLAGADADGVYHAVQTFRQLITKQSGGARMPEVVVKDYPKMPVRGIIEGFYGKPWTFEDRLSQIDFMAAHKMNTYVYAPKDDPYHRNKWREPYPPEELSKLGQLVNAAKAKHVDFVFTVSPGLDVCYSSDEDFRKLVDKAQAMWDLGVRNFAVLLDDITLDMNCDADRAQFGASSNPAASAQAYLLNRFQHEFIETHSGAANLLTVPTDYYQPGTTPYREQFAASVDSKIVVYWTGIGIVPTTVTTQDADLISGIFKHELLLWDNYPVTDYVTHRVFLGPLEGRDAGLVDHHVNGLTSNPMEHAEASKIALYTIADYTWNPAAYDAQRSWNNSIKEFGGQGEEALRTVAENNQSSPLHVGESPVLTRLLQEFWSAYETGDATSQSNALRTELQKLEQLPDSMKSIGNQRFLAEMDPWILKLHHYGKAGKLAVDLLAAMKAGDKETAARLNQELTVERSHDTVDVVVPENRTSSRKLDGINRERGASELIQYTPEFGARTGTNEWGYEITVVNGKVVKEGGYNNMIPADGYVLSLHYEKWLQENAIVGAIVSIDNGTVTISLDKGVYPVPNNKVSAEGVMDAFLQKAAQTYAFWSSGGDTPAPLTSMGTWDMHTPDLMTDGNDETYYWSNEAAQAGDYVGVYLGQIKTVNRIMLLMGTPGSKDIIHQGSLEISTDGLVWRSIGTYAEQRDIMTDLPQATQLKYVRFKATAPQTDWVQVRSWVIETVE